MASIFQLNVARFVEKSVGKMADLHKAIVLELFTSVILDTPVLTGRLRGNWIISSDSPESGTFEITDPEGTKTTKKVEDFVAKIDPKKDFNIYLSNNLPYAYRIEYDGWSAQKAPEGMVRKNLIRIVENLRAK